MRAAVRVVLIVVSMLVATSPALARPRTATIDPFRAVPTLHMVGNILDPLTKEKYGRDPRNIAQKAEAYLVQTGIADTVYFGSEAEFFVFDDIRFDQNEHEGYYFIDSVEGRWN